MLIVVIFLVGCGTTAQAASPNSKNSASNLSVTTTSLPVATVMTTYSAQVTATGGVPPYKWSLAPNTKLPSGVTFDTAQAKLSGIPAQQGSFQVGILVTDSISKTNKNLTLQVTQPLTVGGGALGAATVGSSYSTTLNSSGGVAPISWKLVSGSLPTGLSLGTNGTVSGTPSSTGNSSFTVSATDSSSPAVTGTGTYSLAVISGLKISTSSLTSGTVGQPYSASLSASGGATPYSWSITAGSLPAGLTLNSSNSTISGTPTQSGTFSFTAQAQDSGVPSQLSSVNLSVYVAPTSGSTSGSVPVISNVSVSGITATSATVSWTTDVASDTMAFRSYDAGDYIGYGVASNVTDATGTTSHSVTFTGLHPGQSYWYGVRSRAVGDLSKVGIWEADQASNHFSTLAASTTGSYDFWFALTGGHKVTQGYDLVLGTASGDLGGTSAFAGGTFKVQITNLPPFTQVHWPDTEVYGILGYSITSTATTNDTFSQWSAAQGITVRLQTNQGGTTPAGTYNVSAVVNAGASTGNVSHTINWTVVVEAPTPLATASSTPSFPAIPNLSTWEYRMTHYGAQWCNSVGAPYDQKVWFYDGIAAYQNVRAYTGDSTTWSPCVTNVLNDWRGYLDTVNYNPGFGYRNFPTGLYNDFLQNGSADSKRAVIGLGNDFDWHNAWNIYTASMRESALALDAKRLRDHLQGVPTSAETKLGVSIMLGMVDQVANHTAPQYEPFMCGLMAQSLINYYEDGHQDDVRIPVAIKRLADALYSDSWNKYPQQPNGFVYDSFRYGVGFDDTTGGNYQPDLNLLVAPMYAWLYKYSGDATYLNEGDLIFSTSAAADPNSNADGTLGYAANGGKVWTQSYRWSFDFVKWRSGQ